MTASDSEMRQLLTASRVIAVVGHSDKPHRPSYGVAQYLREVGYRVYAVNPTITHIDGETVYADLAAVPEAIDIVDVFRQAQHLPEVVEEAIAVGAPAVWTQFGVVHPQAEAQARAAGLIAVVDRCIAIEHRRLAIARR